MTRRRVTDDERALWDTVAKQADPIRKPSPEPPEPDHRTPKPKQPPTPKPPAKQRPISPGSFRVGGQVNHHGTHDLLPGLAEQMSKGPIRMDKRTHSKMSKGKLSPEARLDLHGMTLATAYSELNAFIMSSHRAGKRLVLVITGKGKDRDMGDAIPTRNGVLRHQVPQWLSRPPTGPLILQITPAAARHGGYGAYYVYLRKRG